MALTSVDNKYTIFINLIGSAFVFRRFQARHERSRRIRLPAFALLASFAFSSNAASTTAMGRLSLYGKRNIRRVMTKLDHYQNFKEILPRSNRLGWPARVTHRIRDVLTQSMLGHRFNKISILTVTNCAVTNHV